MKENYKPRFDVIRNSIPEIIDTCEDENIRSFIKELYDLIVYQKDVIKQQTIQIVAMKHQEAWKRYDKPIENYDPTIRKYIDKPPKSDNMSC
jgi:myo-inositol catabolism protein IolC